MLENAEDMWGQTKNRKILIAIFSKIYYNSTVKRIYPSKIFFTNPLLIIYTPLETSGSSPTGYFIFSGKSLKGYQESLYTRTTSLTYDKVEGVKKAGRLCNMR